MSDKKAFEETARGLGLMTERSAVRSDWYAYSETQIAWQCWQHATAKAQAEERERMREAMLDEAEVANREGFAEAAHWLEALAQKVGG
jgi:hypothetical protein